MELAHIKCGGACFCISRKSKMKKEQSQDYPFVIKYLSNRYRLIECRDHIQCILQRRDKNVPRWRGIYYFLNTQSMSRILRQFGLDDGVVGQLPERFESRFKTVQREQIKSDDIVIATDRNLLEDKNFSGSHEVKVPEHARHGGDAQLKDILCNRILLKPHPVHDRHLFYRRSRSYLTIAQAASNYCKRFWHANVRCVVYGFVQEPPDGTG